ncbi:MAG: hypothetical protein RRY34_07590, partial [Victivallaceae bacterium]
ISKYFFNKFLESRSPTEYIYQVKRLQELIIMAQNNAGTLGVGYFIGDVLPPGVKYLAINGVTPSRQNIVDNTYPWKISRNLVWPKNSPRQNEIDQLIRSTVAKLTAGDLAESSWILSSALNAAPEKITANAVAEKELVEPAAGSSVIAEKGPALSGSGTAAVDLPGHAAEANNEAVNMLPGVEK